MQTPALDALEYISVGIVKDVLKMKVLSVEEFESLNKATTDLETMTSYLNACNADAEKARLEWREKLNTCEAKFLAESSKKFAVGEKVKGNWQMEGEYYKGVVTAVS